MRSAYTYTGMLISYTLITKKINVLDQAHFLHKTKRSTAVEQNLNSKNRTISCQCTFNNGFIRI